MNLVSVKAKGGNPLLFQQYTGLSALLYQEISSNNFTMYEDIILCKQ